MRSTYSAILKCVNGLEDKEVDSKSNSNGAGQCNRVESDLIAAPVCERMRKLPWDVRPGGFAGTDEPLAFSRGICMNPSELRRFG
jgi:hypothetical protein